MERLTTIEQGCCIACFECNDKNDDCGCPEIDKCLHRLRDYEDTGLTPEEIMGGKILTGWIPITEQLPEDDTDVIVCKSDGIINIAFWSGDAWISLDSNYTLNVFAWMPLPEPYNPQN